MDNINAYHQYGKDAMYKIWHSTDDVTFIYFYTDGGSIVCNEDIYPIQNGVLAFIGAGKYHYTLPDNPETYERSKIFIAPEILNECLKILSPKNRFRKFTKTDFAYTKVDDTKRDAVDKIFKELADIGTDDVSEIKTLSSIMQLLLFFEDSIPEKNVSDNFINQTVTYINRNIYSDIKIDDICDAIHISKPHLCRAFKKATGTTVMNYILKTRIILAQKMLEKEEISITDISERCHFSSVAYFCRVFKSKTGISPLKYRNQTKKP